MIPTSSQATTSVPINKSRIYAKKNKEIPIHAGWALDARTVTDSVFQVVTLMTTTGYMTYDYVLWPTFSQMVVKAWMTASYQGIPAIFRQITSATVRPM